MEQGTAERLLTLAIPLQHCTSGQWGNTLIKLALFKYIPPCHKKNEMETLFGILANSMICLFLLPQLIRLCKRKRARYISFGLLLLVLPATLCWAVFGWLEQENLVVVSSLIAVVMDILTLILYINSPHKLHTRPRMYTRRSEGLHGARWNR